MSYREKDASIRYDSLMRFPWVNSLLCVAAFVLVATGLSGFDSGQIEHAWRLQLHGSAAYALLVLAGWKSAVVLDSLRRRRRGRAWHLSLLGLLLLVLLTGLLWTFRGPLYLAGFSLVTIHIFLAIPTLGLWLWHAWRMRWVVRVSGALDRRLVLRGLGAAVAGGASWGFARRLQRERRFTGSYAVGSWTGRFPVVSWIADYPAPAAPETWRLTVHGAGVGRPRVFSLADLEALPAAAVDAILDCTGGWYTAQTWRGVRLGAVLALADVSADARSVTITSWSGYQRRFPLPEAADYLLATAVADRPLTHGHGFPLRLVAPGQRGVDWVKWIGSIEVHTAGAWRQLPWPVGP